MSGPFEPGGVADQPLPPQNGQVVSPFTKNALDIRWDDPSILGGNIGYTVVGVNIYRSDNSERGPYQRLNEFPVGGGFYRDCTDNVLVPREVVTNWITRGNAPNAPNKRSWVFRTQHPIHKQFVQAPYQSPTFANAPSDVEITVDGKPAIAHEVFGPTGEVTLVDVPDFNVGTERLEQPALPIGEDSVVEISYYTNRNFVISGLSRFTFYRLTTVIVDTGGRKPGDLCPRPPGGLNPSGYRETALAYCLPLTVHAIETMDYIWRESVRRNHWILQQGGERVKVFIRKQAGIPCYCKLDERQVEFSKQASQRCSYCFGTGFIGGYEGPYDVIIAPDDAERRVSQTLTGRRIEHTYEVWTGPSPLLTHRDFLVKQSNERYSIGAVRRPTNRGNILQQHFNIGSLDDGDIRYLVPIDGTDSLPWPKNRFGQRYYPPMPVDGKLAPAWWALPEIPPYPDGTTGPTVMVTPDETEKSNIPDEREQRGRSVTWGNINY